MADPSGFIDFADYYGLNKESSDEEAQRLLADLDTQESDINKASTAGRLGAEERGFAGQSGAVNRATTDDIAKRRMSFGDAVERLRDPATLQEAMRRRDGGQRRNVSGLDAAMTQAAGGERFSKLGDRLTGLDQRLESDKTRGEESYGYGQAGKSALNRSSEVERVERQKAQDRLEREGKATKLRETEDGDDDIDRYGRALSGMDGFGDVYGYGGGIHDGGGMVRVASGSTPIANNSGQGLNPYNWPAYVSNPTFIKRREALRNDLTSQKGGYGSNTEYREKMNDAIYRAYKQGKVVYGDLPMAVRRRVQAPQKPAGGGGGADQTTINANNTGTGWPK